MSYAMIALGEAYDKSVLDHNSAIEALTGPIGYAIDEITADLQLNYAI